MPHLRQGLPRDVGEFSDEQVNDIAAIRRASRISPWRKRGFDSAIAIMARGLNRVYARDGRQRVAGGKMQARELSPR